MLRKILSVHYIMVLASPPRPPPPRPPPPCPPRQREHSLTRKVFDGSLSNFV